MIRKLTLDELIDAAKHLESAEQIVLAAAINEQLTTSGCDIARASAPGPQTPAHDWNNLAVESLSRAYGQAEPDYSEEDLVP